MEVLNKNKRQSAIIRILGFMVIVLVVNAIVLLGFYDSFSRKFTSDEDRLRNELNKVDRKAKAQIQDLKNKMNLQNEEIKKLGHDNNELRKQIDEKKEEIENFSCADLQQQLQNKDDLIRLKEEQIRNYYTALELCKSAQE